MKLENQSSDVQQLLRAIENDDHPIVMGLLKKGVDINSRDEGGSTPLMRASLLAYNDLVDFLIHSKADVNLHDNAGFTALHYAAQEYHEEIARKLIEAGADVNSQDIHGNSPLFKAVFRARNRGALIKLLREHGANDNLPNKHGVTPLSLAHTIANYDAVQFFKD